MNAELTDWKNDDGKRGAYGEMVPEERKVASVRHAPVGERLGKERDRRTRLLEDRPEYRGRGKEYQDRRDLLGGDILPEAEPEDRSHRRPQVHVADPGEVLENVRQQDYADKGRGPAEDEDHRHPRPGAVRGRAADMGEPSAAEHILGEAEHHPYAGRGEPPVPAAVRVETMPGKPGLEQPRAGPGIRRPGARGGRRG